MRARDELKNRACRHLVLGMALALLVTAPAVAKGPSAEELAEQSERLLARIDQRQKEIIEWETLEDRFEGDDQRAIEIELSEKKLQNLSDLHRLAGNVVKQEKAGVQVDDLRRRVESMMLELPTFMRAHLEEAIGRGSKLRAERDAAGPDELYGLEQRIAREDGRVRRIVRIYFDHVRSMRKLGLDVSEQEEWLRGGLSRFTDLLSGRVELTLDRRTELEERIAANPDDAAAKTEMTALERRLDSNIEVLEASVEVMTELGMDPTREQELIVETTGNLTSLLDKDVAASFVQKLASRGKAWAAEMGPTLAWRLFLFLLILLVFRTLAGMARRVTVRALASSKVETSRLLKDMITSMVGRTVMVLGFLVALSQVGLSLGPVLAGLGVAGFVIGFALQDTLSNFAAGMMILFYRPFDVDDLVEVGGISGKVSRMTLVSTTILTLDHQTLIVPNSKIWGDVIKNVTAQKTRRVDLVFGISYQDDIPKAERILEAIVSEHPKVLDEPEPMVRLHSLGESSVDFVVRPWASTADYWDVYWDVTREVKLRFDREGISIPFPQRDVHVYSEKAAVGGG